MILGLSLEVDSRTDEEYYKLVVQAQPVRGQNNASDAEHRENQMRSQFTMKGFVKLDDRKNSTVYT